MSSALKNLTHKMFLDTNFNSLSTVLSTIYKNFLESAMKYYRYAKCMTAGMHAKHPHASLLIGTIFDDQCSILPVYNVSRSYVGLYAHLGHVPLGTIRDVVELAFVLVKAKPKKLMVQDYKCAVSKRQVQW